MANITKGSNPSLTSVLSAAGAEHRLTGGLAGEAIAAADSVYVKSDGTIWRSNGTAATAPAKCAGLAATAAAVGEPVTIFRGVLIAYGASLTPGAMLYVSATAGALADAATTGGTAPVGFVWADGANIFIHGSTY